MNHDRCDRCGGDIPVPIDCYDDHLTRGGDCPGNIVEMDWGAGCGAWTEEAHETAYRFWRWCQALSDAERATNSPEQLWHTWQSREETK